MTELTWIPFDFMGGWNPTQNVQSSVPGLSLGLRDNELESCQDFHYAGPYRLESRLGIDLAHEHPGTGFVNGIYEYRKAGASGYTTQIVLVCGNALFFAPSFANDVPATANNLGSVATHPVTFIDYNNKLIMGQGEDIKSWEGTTLTDITGAPTAWMLCNFRRRVWVAGSEDYPWRLWYSDIDDETVWNLTEGILDLDGHAAIKAIVRSYNDLFLLCENEIWQIINTEEVETMQAIPIMGGINAITQRACVSLHGSIYFLATDSIYVLSQTGEITDLLATKHNLKRWYQQTIDIRHSNTTPNGACGAWIPELQSIAWVFPSTASSSPNKNNTCIVLHVPSGNFSQFSWTAIQTLYTGLSSGGGTTVKKQPLYLGDQSGDWYMYGGTGFTQLTDDDGSDIVGQVYTKYIDTNPNRQGERDVDSAFLVSQFSELKFFYTTSGSIDIAITASIDGDTAFVVGTLTANGSGLAEFPLPGTLGKRIQLRFDIANMNQQIALYDGLLGIRPVGTR